MKSITILFLFCHLFASPMRVPTERYDKWENSRDLPGFEPFIGHISFRNMCDHIIDQSTEWFDPDSVRQGDLIYLNLWYIDWFTQNVHDKIHHPYILVSGDIGGWFPDPGNRKFLYDPKLAAWFCRNMVFSYHPKLFQLPMGQDLYLFDRHASAVDQIITAYAHKKPFPKEHLLYVNFCTRPHGDRDKIAQFFKGQPFCHSVDQNVGLPRDLYYQQLAASKFTLSPLGLETDSVRTWEALVFDSIPIVEHTFQDAIYEGLPVLIVDDWTKIDAPFLESKYEELKDLKRDKAYFNYWRRLIKNTQQKVKNDDLAFTELEATLFSSQDLETINAILQNSDRHLLYKGFLSTLRPLQLSQSGLFHIDLYDPWVDRYLINYMSVESHLPSDIELLASETDFSARAAGGHPVSVFLDLTYYRTSLRLGFGYSVCREGNFRHSLKPDLEALYDDLHPGSLLFGNMADEPYVKKTLHSFAEENGVQIDRNGPFWSIVKQQKTFSLQELFPEPYSAIREMLLPFEVSKWCAHGPNLQRLIQDNEMKNAVIIGGALDATALRLAEMLPPGGKVFTVSDWTDETQFQHFLSNVIHAALTDQIVPVRKTSLSAAKEIHKLDLPIHLIYFETLTDHASTYQMMQTWHSFVSQGSLLCGGGWNISEVQRALVQFARERNQILLHEGSFWMLL